MMSIIGGKRCHDPNDSEYVPHENHPTKSFDTIDGVFTIPPGNLSFNVGTKTVLKFQPDGKVFVRGEQVDDNKVIYAQLCEWLGMVRNEAGMK
jgi:hypothetical protein